MMFKIEEFTQARIATITNRAEKHGDDEKPGVSIGIEITTANTILDEIDANLRETMFKGKGEPELPGVPPSTPVLRCNLVERVNLELKHEGWTLGIDVGIDGERKPMKFGAVKVDKFSVEPKQGGSIVLRMRLGTSDVDATRLGWVGMHIGADVWLTLTPPEKLDDDKVTPIKAAKPKKGAKDPATGQASKDALDASGNNPFGTKDATDSFLDAQGTVKA